MCQFEEDNKFKVKGYMPDDKMSCPECGAIMNREYDPDQFSEYWFCPDCSNIEEMIK